MTNDKWFGLSGHEKATRRQSFERVRFLIPSVLTCVLVLAVGSLGFRLTVRANDEAEQIHRSDLNVFQAGMSGLGKQYVAFTIKEAADAATLTPWAVPPGGDADRDHLRRFIERSVLFDHAAALWRGGEVVASASREGITFPTFDTEHAEFVEGIVRDGVGVSGVLHAGELHLVAVGARVAAAPDHVFVGYFNAEASALQAYVQQLEVSGVSHILDGTGTVLASSDPERIGERFHMPEVLSALAANRSGFIEQPGDGDVASYHPFGIAGWSGVTTQTVNEFFGAIRRDHAHIKLAFVAILAVASTIILVLGYKRETARRRFHEELAFQAYHDNLTGLLNRAHLHESLSRALARARRSGTDVGVAYLDLDGFKAVNDAYGHEVGDDLLVEVASRLLAVVRQGDLVARLGGDEFAIVFENLADRSVATEVLHRIVTALEQPIAVGGVRVTVGASAGLAYSDGSDGVDEVLRDADLAMYRAKDTSTSTVGVFDGQTR